MPSISRTKSSRRAEPSRSRAVLPACATLASAGSMLVALAGCAQTPRPDAWSDSARLLMERYESAELRHRNSEPMTVSAVYGSVTHLPQYFEDPFVDKGHGREGEDKPYVDWADAVAAPYAPARFMLNLFALPVSMVVTPPWTLMESDGKLSRQLLGYDHDAIRVEFAGEPAPEAHAEPVNGGGVSQTPTDEPTATAPPASRPAATRPTKPQSRSGDDDLTPTIE